VKVPASVLFSEGSRDVAIVRVDPSVVATRPALELACPPSRTPSLDDGQTIATIAVPHDAEKELVRGDVIALQPRRIETNVRLAFGGSGGPVFNEAGAVVGLTATSADPDSRWRDASVVPTIFICEALAASLRTLSTAQPSATTQLPVDPARPFPAGALEIGPKGTTPNATVPVLSSSDFDVAFITPPMVHRARQRSGWTGGQTGRTPEAEARIGRLTEFGAWSDYFANLPPVLVVRVTPKMVESFWKRVGREAARTQGANLPAFKDFKSSFHHMRASCAGVEVPPIHPFVLEHRVSEKNVIREGLYVFDPDAFGPQCGTVTLSLYPEAQPTRADTLAPTRAVLDQIWRDFAPYRATSTVTLALTGTTAMTRPAVSTSSFQDQAERIVQQLRQLPTPLPATVRSDGTIDPLEQQRRELYDELRQLGRIALPALVRGLKESDVQLRKTVALALGVLAGNWFDPSKPRMDIRAALPALITTLQDEDGSVRAWSAQAIGQIGPDAAQAVPALVTLLGRADEGSRNSACIALFGIGPAAKDALPALENALSDPSADVRRFARRAIEKIRTQ
jgi:hypothetical protein